MFNANKQLFVVFAPRMWRCFLPQNLLGFLIVVCSTHVEMFLLYMPVLWVPTRLLHACGDVSEVTLSIRIWKDIINETSLMLYIFSTGGILFDFLFICLF